MNQSEENNSNKNNMGIRKSCMKATEMSEVNFVQWLLLG